MSLTTIDNINDKYILMNYIKNTLIVEEQYKRDIVYKSLKGKIIGLLFYEPSTRTRVSFEVAVKKLGGDVILVNNLFSSHQKGESIEDTIKTMECYCDALIVRHPEKNIMNRILSVSKKTIINAGDGDGEHPTQALLDAYTIYKYYHSFDLTYTFVGDLKYSRTVHSLIKLISVFSNIKIYLVSPPELKLPEEYIEILNEKNIVFYEREEMEECLLITNVLYMTRLQKERFSEGENINYKNYCLTKKKLKRANKNMIILHPLPRNEELSPEIDNDPRAKYIEQMENGLYMRINILQNLFEY